MSLLALVGLLGVLVGFLLGVTARDAYDLLQSVMCTSREVTMLKRSVCWLRNNVLILLVIVFAGSQVALAGLLIQQRAASSSYESCKADWDTKFMASYTARVNVAKDVSEAMDEVVEATTTGDAEKFIAARDNYLDVRDDQRAAQEANPLPEPPQQVCGKKVR